MKNKGSYLTYIPAVVTVAVIVAACVLFRNCDINTIINFTPDNLILAIFVMLGIFAVKSISVVLPVSVVMMSTGMIYSFRTALVVNFIGVLICFTISYFSGKIVGKDIVNRLSDKYPKVNKIMEKGRRNNIFTAYILPTVGVPTDIGSMLMGAAGISYNQFMLGSLLGMIPKIILYTIIGNSIDNSVSLKNIILIAVIIVIMFCISFAANRYVNKNSEKEY